MRRRHFVEQLIGSASMLAATGCSILPGRKINLERDIDLKRDPGILKITRPKPKPGVMPMGEIGKTGIKVSKFGFGAHMSLDLLPYEKEREFMIREAFDMGINLFDVYDQSWNIHQYEPTGRHLAPIINDVVLSFDMTPMKGLTVEQEVERILKLFRRDHIDLMRLHAVSLEDGMWKEWDTLLRFKKQGKIRAVGVAIHFMSEADIVVPRIPVDYVIFPYNFYHNIIWDGRRGEKFDSLAVQLRKKGVGVVTMKPMGTDNFINSLIDVADKLKDDPSISLPQAALRHIQNCGLNPDTTLTGMYSANQLYEDIEAYFKPDMSPGETQLLNDIRRHARVVAATRLPEYYRFLDAWAPTSLA